jgi:hypothetical protein
MSILSKPSGAARTSITYITAGALIDVWTVIYWVYLNRHPEGHSDASYYWVYGFFFTGLVLLVIGLALGRIGRAARHAELPLDASDGSNAEAPASGSPTAVNGSNNGVPQYYTVPGPVVAPAPVAGQPTAAVPVAIRQVR